MDCRENCGVCCIIPSISSKIPGMPDGKKIGQKCIHLLDNYSCAIYDTVEKPKVCCDFKADILLCGNNRDEAIKLMTDFVKLCD